MPLGQMFIRWKIQLNQETRIYIEHIPNVLNEMTTLADELSRRVNSKSKRITRMLEQTSTEYRTVEGYFVKWMEGLQ